MKNIKLILFVMLIITACNTANLEKNTVNSSAVLDITIPELKEHILYLASEECAGRKPGTEGDFYASNYIRQQFQNYGLELLAEGAFQKFEVIKDIELGENNNLKINDFSAKLNEDFVPFSFTKNCLTKARVVFAGYGISLKTDSIVWDDYANIDVKDKWVMILRGDPDMDNPKSKFVEFADERTKVLIAKDHGAIGVLFVTGEKIDKKDALVSLFYDKSEANSNISVINIKREIVDMILKKSGHTIKSLEENITGKLQTQSFETDAIVEANTEVIQTKAKTQNVIGLLSCDEKNAEYIVVGAHYDHLGMGGQGSGSRVPDTSAMHFGADDNASGVAAVIELAGKFAEQKHLLKKNIIFMAFGAEEMGLLGSNYFVNNPLIEIDKIDAMINFDMLGRLKPDSRSLLIGGTGTSFEADSIIKSVANNYDLDLSLSPEGYGASDHSSFYAKDIPVSFISTGAHKDYHTPQDTTGAINFEGLKEVSDFSYDLVSAFAFTDRSLTFNEAGPKSRSGAAGKYKVTLGIMPDFAQSDNNGLRVEVVRKGGPAFGGGMKDGDIIIKMNGKSVSNIYDYMARLKVLNAGETVTVDVLREEKEEVLIIQL